MKKIFLFFIFIIVLSCSTLALGTISLDKTTYHISETATVTGSCNLANEENVAGYFVWRKQDGTILRSVATNSGSCLTSFFGDSYTFYESSFSGNVTFSVSPTGNGYPPFWGGVSDIYYVFFNVSTPHPIDCYIVLDDTKCHNPNLGDRLAANIRVIDSVTNGSIIGANCFMNINFNDGNCSDKLIARSPTNNGYITTGATGDASFIYDLTETFWKTNTGYQIDINCYCANNTNDVCYSYNETDKIDIDFKACSITGIFTTGDDKRRNESNKLPILFFQIFTIVLAFYLGFRYMNKGIENNGFYFVGYYIFVFGVIQIAVTYFILYANETLQGIQSFLLTYGYLFLLSLIFLLFAPAILWVGQMLWSATKDDSKRNDK